MALTGSLLDLTTVTREIGRGVVLYEAGAYAGSGTDVALTHLGDTEGEIKVEIAPAYQELTTPELTGPIAHSKYLQGIAPKVTIPLYSATPALNEIVSPGGALYGGRDRRVAVTEYLLAILPEELFIESDAAAALGYTTSGDWTVGGDAATAAQLALLDLGVWFWRGHFEPLEREYRHEDAGKMVQEVTFVAMHNENMQQGDYVYTLGRPDQRTPAIELSVT